MATTEVKRTYLLSEFPNTRANPPILKAEIAAAALGSATIDTVAGVAGTVEVRLSGLLSAADQLALDGVIAAHQGDDFAPVPAQLLANAEASDDTGAEVLRAELDSGPLPEGSYILVWSMQVGITTGGGPAAAAGRFIVNQNGGPDIEVDSGVERNGDWMTISGSAPVEPLAGNSFKLSAFYQRTGPGPNPARVRKVRLFIASLT